jgi:hypothetical protein
MHAARWSRRSRRTSPRSSALSVGPRFEALEDRTLPGLFLAAKTFATGSSPYAEAAADLNRGGRPDLVVAKLYSASVSVLLGNGIFQSAVNMA